MKKLIFLFIILVVTAGCSRAQTNQAQTTQGQTTQAQTTQTQTSQAQTNTNIDHIPPYRILNTDSVYVTPDALKKNKPVMIIYFSPDCSHCQRLMNEMKQKMSAFKRLQIVMITWIQYKAIKNFYRDYGISAYPNITIGTEGYTYLVQKYYHVINTPFIAFYNKKGKLVKTIEKEPKIEDLVKIVKKL